MAQNPVYVPKFGMTMTEAYIVEWLVGEGQQVNKDQPLLVIETEKANSEINAPAAGFVTGIKYAVGDTAQVGEIVAVIVDSLEEAAAPVSASTAKAETKGHEPAAVPAPAPTGMKPFEGIRKQIADNMRFSLSNTAQLSFFREVDVEALKQYKATLSGVSYNDLLLKALALVLRDNPVFRTQLVDGKLIVLDDIRIGLAISIERGLTVPVLDNVDKLTLPEVAEAREHMVNKARAGKLEFAEMSGAVCTLTNLGTYDIDYFTPILNPPETLILGVGRIAERPWVSGGQIVAHLTLPLSLTVDHQLVDGTAAAECLQKFNDLLSHPQKMDGIE